MSTTRIYEDFEIEDMERRKEEEQHLMNGLLTKDDVFNTNFLIDEIGLNSTNNQTSQNFAQIQLNQSSFNEDVPMNNFSPSTMSTVTESSFLNSLNNLSDIMRTAKGKSYSMDVNKKIKSYLVKHNIPFTCKYRADGIRKKQKVHFIKWIMSILNAELNLCLGSQKTKLGKLKQAIVSEINIEKTRLFLSKTIRQVFEEDVKSADKKSNKILFNKLLLNECNFYVKRLLSKTLCEAYNDYTAFGLQNDLNKLSSSNEPQYLEVYIEFALKFVEYFFLCDPNQNSSREVHKNKGFFIYETNKNLRAMMINKLQNSQNVERNLQPSQNILEKDELSGFSELFLNSSMSGLNEFNLNENSDSQGRTLFDYAYIDNSFSLD